MRWGREVTWLSNALPAWVCMSIWLQLYKWSVCETRDDRWSRCMAVSVSVSAGDNEACTPGQVRWSRRAVEWVYWWSISSTRTHTHTPITGRTCDRLTDRPAGYTRYCMIAAWTWLTDRQTDRQRTAVSQVRRVWSPSVCLSLYVSVCVRVSGHYRFLVSSENVAPQPRRLVTCYCGMAAWKCSGVEWHLWVYTPPLSSRYH